MLSVTIPKKEPAPQQQQEEGRVNISTGNSLSLAAAIPGADRCCAVLLCVLCCRLSCSVIRAVGGSRARRRRRREQGDWSKCCSGRFEKWRRRHHQQQCKPYTWSSLQLNYTVHGKHSRQHVHVRARPRNSMLYDFLAWVTEYALQCSMLACAMKAVVQLT